MQKPCQVPAVSKMRRGTTQSCDFYHWHETCPLIKSRGYALARHLQRHCDDGETWMEASMVLNTPPMDRVVEPELRAFLVSLSHLPVEVQLDLLRDATKQIAEVLDR